MTDSNLAPSSPLNIVRTAAMPISGSPYVSAPEEWNIAKRDYRAEMTLSFSRYGGITVTVEDKDNQTARLIVSAEREATQAAIIDFCDNCGHHYGDVDDLDKSDSFLDAVVAATLRSREINQTRRAKLAEPAETEKI